MVPMRPAMSSNHTMPHLVNGAQQLPQSPQRLAAPQSQTQVMAQNAPAPQPSPPVTQPTAGDTTSAPPDVAPSEEQDWDLDINWDELEALDRSEWQANDSAQVEDHNTPLDLTQIVVEAANEQPSGVLAESGFANAPPVEAASINEQGTLVDLAVGESFGSASLAQPKITTPDASRSELEDSAAQQLNSHPNHEPAQALEHPKSLAEDVIDIDELPGDEAAAGPDQPQIQKQSSTGPVSSALNEDVITIHEQQPETLARPGSISAPQASIYERGTLVEPTAGKPSGGALLAHPKATTPEGPRPEVEDSAAQQLNAPPNHSPAQVLKHPMSLDEDVIDIDELPGDEAVVDPEPSRMQKQSTEPVSPALDEDVINIQYSDDEMEVDELDPSEPPGSIGPSDQPDDEPISPSTQQAKQAKSDTPQLSTTSRIVPIQNQKSTNGFNSLPPHIRTELRQKAKEPLIAHYLSISPKTREAAEARFQAMSDQEVFELYDKMGHARRVVDHYKNMLVQSSHKIHLPHIDVREPPPEPPTVLCSVMGTVRLRSEAVEFSITSKMMASLERWRARFVTPAGSHGDLITVELTCYPRDSFRPSDGKDRRELSPNAQTRTWPDGGILWAFINSEDELKDRNVRLFLSPPPFVSPRHIQTGHI
ncbi:unnamed protein product [Rhizoctonia solani]|uniref:Uncharacterized protein n=1 Tax=Rhizoctonia solani TaxID=456999 RepID=A0A8H3CGJ1_9AGAM|nr:unnamed protein product [Rhizoctonia solani]